MNLDLTLNSDFSNVEVDDFSTNLIQNQILAVPLSAPATPRC